MKYQCEMIQDLLPLYKDGVCSDSSKQIIEEHLQECPVCTKFLDELKDTVIDEVMLATLGETYKEKQKAYSAAVVDLAKMEVLNHNRKGLDRMLENERHQPSRISQEKETNQAYKRGTIKENNKKIIPEQERAVTTDDTCASYLPENTVRRTIGRTTYIANLHFKEQGQTFSQKLKRALKAEAGGN